MLPKPGLCWFKSAIGLVGLLGIGLWLTPPARSDSDDAKIAGVVTAVGGSSVPNTLTVHTAQGDVTVNITVDTEFENDDDDAPAPNLTTLIGLFVQVEYDPATMNADEVEVDREFEALGRVVAVGGTTLPTTVTIETYFGPRIVVTVNSETEVEIDGLEDDDDTLTDPTVLVGRDVKVEYDPNTGIASELEADDDDRYVRGSFVSMDLANEQITLLVDGVEQTFTVEEDTEVSLDYQDANLWALAAGMRVILEVDDDAEVERIWAFTIQPASVQGTVTSVSTTSQTVSLTPTKPGQPTLVKVNAGTKIKGTVQPGARVKIKYVERNGLAVARMIIAKKLK